MTAPSPGPRANELTTRGHPLVLIVDDNEKNRKLARDVLRAGGFRTLEAASAADGIATAEAHLPDVILMDLHLPDRHGADAARELGQGTKTRRIPVVALSSSPLEGAGDWLLAAGFAGYLQKPFSVKEFPGMVREFCASA